MKRVIPFLLALLIHSSATFVCAQTLSTTALTGYIYDQQGQGRAGIEVFVVRTLKDGQPVASVQNRAVSGTGGAISLTVVRGSTIYLFSPEVPAWTRNGRQGVPYAIPDSATYSIENLALLSSVMQSQGDTVVAGPNARPQRVAGNTANGVKFFGQIGTLGVAGIPGWWTITGSGLTATQDNSTKTLTLGYAPTSAEILAAFGTQSANTVFAGPTTGSAATAAFRVLVAADIPNLSSIYQTLDSDLTAISALSTTAFGRGLLIEPNAASLRTTAGLVIGTDVAAFNHTHPSTDISDSSAVGRTLLTAANAAAQRSALGLVIGTDVSAFGHTHPQSDVTNLVSDLALLAPKASPVFTGNPTAPTATAGDNDTSIATTAFVSTAVAAGGGATSEINVANLATGGTGASKVACWTGWDTTIGSQAAAFTRYKFKKGYYCTAGGTNWGNYGVEVIGEAGTYIVHTGASGTDAFTMDAGATQGTLWYQNVKVENIIVIGNYASLTGTVSVTGGSAIVTGVGTSFLSQVSVGDAIDISAQEARIVQSVDSNTQITTTANWSGNRSGANAIVGKTRYGFYLRGIRNGIFRHIAAHDVAKAGFWGEATVTNILDNYRITYHEPAQGTGFNVHAQYGLVIAERGIDTSTTWTVTNPVIEGLMDTGIWVRAGSYSNTFIGGTSEGNPGKGAVLAGNSNAFYGTDFEANTVVDVDITGSRNLLSDVLSGGTIEINNGAQNQITGGNLGTVTIGLSATYPTIENSNIATAFNNPNGTTLYKNLSGVAQNYDSRSGINRNIVYGPGFGGGTIDVSRGNVLDYTVSANFSIVNPANGTDGQLITFRFNAVGAGTFAITWGSKYRSGSGNLLSSILAPNIYYLRFVYNASADYWEYQDGKMDLGGYINNATVGSVLYVASGRALGQSNSNFFWDASNNRLGIGTTSPARPAHFVVDGSGYAFRAGDAVGTNYLDFVSGGSESRFEASGNRPLRFQVNSISAISIIGDGKVAIGATSAVDSGKLTLTGDGTVGAAMVIVDSAASGRTFWFAHRAGGTAGRFGLYDSTGTAYRWVTDNNKNFGIGATSFGTNAANVLALANGTAPTTGITGVQLWADSGELKVMDSAANSTTLSPHNFSAIPGGASEEMAWSFYSERDGKVINVDMLRVVRLLEQLTGEKLVFIAPKGTKSLSDAPSVKKAVHKTPSRPRPTTRKARLQLERQAN